VTQGSTPPGWYDDGTGTRRWWDGSGWTDHTQAGAGAPADGGPTHVRGAQPSWQPQPQQPQQPAYAQGYPQQQPGQPGQPGQVSWVRRNQALAAVLAVVVALVLLGGAVGLALALGGDDGDDDGIETRTAPASTETVESEPSEPESTEPEPEPSQSSGPSEPLDPSDPGATTCGQVRAATPEELVDLLDRAAREDGSPEAQEYLDLPDAQKRQFAEIMPTLCAGEDDDTALDDIDGF
jgi:hypothetical protein